MSGVRCRTRLVESLTKAFHQRQRKQRSQDTLRASPSPCERTSELSAAVVHFHNDSECGCNRRDSRTALSFQLWLGDLREMKRNHLGEDKCVTVFSPWLHRLSVVEKPPADETRRQSSEIQVPARRSTFLVYVCARHARLATLVKDLSFFCFSSQASRSQWWRFTHCGGKIKLAKHLQSWWIWPEVNYCVFTRKLPAFEVMSQIRAVVKRQEQPSSPSDSTKASKCLLKLCCCFFFLMNVLCVLLKKKNK